MTRRTNGLRRRLLILLGVPIAVGAGLGVTHPLTTLAASSAQVGYLTDTSGGGLSLWTDSFGLSAVADGGTYSTATPASAASVTIHNISMTSLDTVGSTALNGLDTLVMFMVCDIGSHPNALKNINAFLDASHKIIIMDAAQCTGTLGGNPDYSQFERPFTPANSGTPSGATTSGPYTFIEPSGLTNAMPDCGTAPCNEPGNSITDGSVLTTTSTGWCTALAGTSNNNVSGPVMAYTRNTAGTAVGTGLVIYEGEAFAQSSGGVATSPTAKHLRLVFDDMVTKAWNADGLTCTRAVGGPPPIAETHLAIFIPVIGFVVVVGGLLATMVRRRRRVVVA